MATPWTYAYDDTVPAGSDQVSTLDTVITNMKKLRNERLGDDLYGISAGETDKDLKGFKQLTIVTQGSHPSNVANKMFIHGYDVNGKVEIFITDEDGNHVQLTEGGYIKAGAINRAKAKAGFGYTSHNYNNSTTTKMDWSDAVTYGYDVGGNFDMTNERFIAPRTGYYGVKVQVLVNDATPAAHRSVMLQLKLNGTEISRTRSSWGDTYGWNTIVLVDQVYMTAAQYIEVDITPVGFGAGYATVYDDGTWFMITELV